jgi:hypothetical protein
MRTARAAVCEAPNTPFVIKEYPLRPVRPREVRFAEYCYVVPGTCLRGIHNYHPRHLIQALDFVRSNRHRVPFHQIVDSKFSLLELDLAFKKASERTVLRAAIVP